MEDMEKFDCLYTDETGDVHPCYVQDTMEGKHGFTGIVYLNREFDQNGKPLGDSKEIFNFVENDRVSRIQ